MRKRLVKFSPRVGSSIAFKIRTYPPSRIEFGEYEVEWMLAFIGEIEQGKRHVSVDRLNESLREPRLEN
jgi:hypothetical protein